MSAPPNILLIDDDEPVRQLAGDLLREEFPDSQIHEVDSLAGLQQTLESGGFSIVITDYQLGWTDGLAVLREVKRRYPDCSVVMFTGTGSEEIAVEAMKAGLDDYVLKSPQHIARLSASIRTVLAQAEERRTARDIEARCRSLLNDVLDTSAVGVFILDASFRVVWINEAMERYFGLRRADVIGRDKRRLVQDRIKQLFEAPEEFAAKVLPTYERNGVAVSFDCHVLAGEAREERWLEHRSLPIRAGLYAGGRIEHYYDITDRKRAEEQIRALAKFPDENPNPILRVKVDGMLLYANKASRSLLEPWGCVPGRMVAEPLRRKVAAILAEGKSKEWEEVVGERTVVFLLVPFTDSGYANLYGRDVTERKRIERQGLQMARLAAMGQLLGGIAHEIRNPLFILTGRLQLLREKVVAQDYATILDDLVKTEAAAKRVIHVTERFLKLARPARPRRTPCAVRTVLEQTLEFLGNELMRNQVRVDTAIASGLPPIQADPKQLQEAFLNLMMNAMQAMVAANGKGTLTVKAELSAVSAQPSASEEKPSAISHQPSAPAERWIEVRIQDDGPGIRPEHRANIFEPFFSTKPPAQGMGLGLWAVRMIVMALGGTVTYESDVGRGTTFIVRLPATGELNH